MPLPSNIKRQRLALNLTQLQLAHKIGQTGEQAGAYISKLESGDTEPRLRTLSLLAKVLKTTIAELISDND